MVTAQTLQLLSVSVFILFIKAPYISSYFSGNSTYFAAAICLCVYIIHEGMVFCSFSLSCSGPIVLLFHQKFSVGYGKCFCYMS